MLPYATPGSGSAELQNQSCFTTNNKIRSWGGNYKIDTKIPNKNEKCKCIFEAFTTSCKMSNLIKIDLNLIRPIPKQLEIIFLLNRFLVYVFLNRPNLLLTLAATPAPFSRISPERRLREIPKAPSSSLWLPGPSDLNEKSVATVWRKWTFLDSDLHPIKMKASIGNEVFSNYIIFGKRREVTR